jgi:hypothetical protein
MVLLKVTLKRGLLPLSDCEKFSLGCEKALARGLPGSSRKKKGQRKKGKAKQEQRGRKKEGKGEEGAGRTGSGRGSHPDPRSRQAPRGTSERGGYHGQKRFGKKIFQFSSALVYGTEGGE